MYDWAVEVTFLTTREVVQNESKVGTRGMLSADAAAR